MQWPRIHSWLKFLPSKLRAGRRAPISGWEPFFFFGLWLAIPLILLCGVPAVHALGDVDTSYVRDLIQRANQFKLAEEREWHLLLHYRENLFRGYTSEADDPSFFLASDGRTNPQVELESTIRSFFSDELVGRSKQPAQCAFIARYHWLNERLSFDSAQLPPLSCERFESWFGEMNADAVTLIFASAFLDNPASMFGHTFLRIDQKGQTEQTRLLAYTINYAADVPAGEGALYPIKGIFGGFKGYFMTPPYYLKVQEYRDIENRDIWEYRLNLSEAQVRRLLEHAWELGNAYFDYFFFKENCSYHILSLIEYADPSLRLTDQFHVWTVPAETVRLLAAHQGLVKAIVYRPSRRTSIRRKWELLSPDERQTVVRLAGDRGSGPDSELLEQSPPRQAFVLDVASDYVRYRSESDRDHAAVYKERNRELLSQRSALRIPSGDIKILPYADHPDLGHNTSRASVGGGWRNNDTFEEVAVRAGYHDLLDPEIGYTPDAQIEIASMALRHYNRADQTRIERATLANVVSLSPMDALFHTPSWKVNIGMQTIKHNSCQLCSNGVFNAGGGAALETRWLKREVYFAFAETEANYSKAYTERHRAGGGGTAGMLADLTDRWKLMATSTYLKYALGEKSDDFRWFVGSRYTLSQNWALRLEYNHRDHDNDVLFSVQAFF